MAEGTREAKNVSCDGILEPASPSLQNCIKFSNSGSYFSVLCDFGVVCVCDLKDTGASFRAVVVKKLAFDKGEVLEGHAWSSDDQVFAVAGCKIYLFQVSKGFCSLHTIPLYYMPKDISLIVRDSSCVNKMYTLAVAGPNGVELYQMEIGDTLSMVETSSLHSDLAIALVQFSPDKHYLAVAALDGHFGIWTVSSLDTDHKEFWYVHLKTVRITSMEFSPDSSMVAVAGWEGSWHSYRKTVQNERMPWIEFHHGKSPDRVSGDLPGSFISWSPDNRFIRLTRYKESKVFLSTFDTQTSITTVTPLAGIVKGVASFREPSGNYSLCFLRSKQCFAVPWPSDQAVPVKTTAAPKQTTQLFFQESFEGSVRVELSAEGGVTLRWRRTPQENLALLREMSKTRSDNTDFYQPSSNVQQCTPMRESNSVGYDQAGLSKAQAGDGIKSNGDCTHGKTSEICIKSEEDSDKSGELNTDITEKGVQALEIKEIIINGHKSLKKAEPRTSELSEDIYAVGYTEGSLQNTSQRGNMASMSERNESICGSLGSCQTSQGSPTNECHPKAPDVTGHTSRVSNGVCSIQAPFLNPSLFQRDCSDSSPLLLGNSVQLLNSTSYVIVALLPLLAHIYHHKNEEWGALMFPCAVKCCCITEDKYLAILTNDGRVTIWCLESMEMLYSSHEILCGTDSGLQSCLMSGSPYKPQFVIMKLDRVGTGEILRMNFQPNHGDTHVTVNRLPVCYPELPSHSCSNQLCGSIDHLIIFKQSHSEGGDQTNLSQKWVVIVPGLGISQAFLEERECSLEEFVARHHSALCKLNALAVINR